MPTIPKAEDFPKHVTVVISYPGSHDNTPPPEPGTSPTAHHNILVLLHGLGDTAANFASFGRDLNLPETTCITVQAPTPLPASFIDREGYHWGNDIMFDDNGTLAMDAAFDRAREVIVKDVITDTLVNKLGYKLRDIMLLGYGQGGMAALDAARHLGLHPPVADELPEAATISSSSSTSTPSGTGGGAGADATEEMSSKRTNPYHASLSGVVSFGAAYPLSASTLGPKDRTPVFIVAGRDDGGSAVTDTALKRTRDVFEFVDIHRWPTRGDRMPRDRDEMLPVMQFFARRLRSRKGVPAGSIELT